MSCHTCDKLTHTCYSIRFLHNKSGLERDGHPEESNLERAWDLPPPLPTVRVEQGIWGLGQVDTAQAYCERSSSQSMDAEGQLGEH